MKRILLSIPVLLFSLNTWGQYFQFSQYNYAPQLVTPTAPANSDYARINYIYRNQLTGADKRINTNALAINYPLISQKTGHRWSGIGVSVMDDQVKDIYSIREGSLSYAINMSLARNQSLSVGVKGLYQSRKINPDNLPAFSEYVSDRQFGTLASNGENTVYRSANIYFSSGVSWQSHDKKGIRTAYWNLSFFNINKRPLTDENGDRDFNQTLLAAGGFRAFQSGNLSVFPELLYAKTSSDHLVNVGLITRCDVKNARNKVAYYVDVITKYVVDRSAIVGMQFHNENFSVGVSYDALVNRDYRSNIGALEIGLELRGLVSPQQKKQPAVKPAGNKPGYRSTSHH